VQQLAETLACGIPPEVADKSEDETESGGYPRPYCYNNLLFFFLLVREKVRANVGVMVMVLDLLTMAYPWIKAVHVMAVLSWMAGLFYLPRLFVYHAERATIGSELDQVFQVMEHRLLRFIMTPAMLVAWGCGVAIALIPGVVDWSSGWAWIKLAGVLAMTWMHHWLGLRRRDFAQGRNRLNGRAYRLMNEVPTLLMIVIVAAVIVRPF